MVRDSLLTAGWNARNPDFPTQFIYLPSLTIRRRIGSFGQMNVETQICRVRKLSSILRMTGIGAKQKATLLDPGLSCISGKSAVPFMNDTVDLLFFLVRPRLIRVLRLCL